MTKNEMKGHLAMFMANSFWGGMSPLAKTLMLGGVVSPLVLTDLRITCAMICFWLLSFCLPREHVPHGDLLRLFFAALLGIVFNQGSFLFAVSLTSPANASIMTTSMPMWTMILAAFILKEPITSKKIFGLTLGAIGALVLIVGSSEGMSMQHSPLSILGDCLAILAQVSYALYMVLYKNFINRYSLVTIMKWMFTYSFLIMLPCTAPSILNTAWEQLSFKDISIIAYIALLGTFACYLLVVIGMRQLRPTVAGMYNYVQPTVACILAILWGLDTVTLPKVLAVACIFCGVYLVTVSKTKKQIEEYHKQQALKAQAVSEKKDNQENQ